MPTDRHAHPSRDLLPRTCPLQNIGHGCVVLQVEARRRGSHRASGARPSGRLVTHHGTTHASSIANKQNRVCISVTIGRKNGTRASIYRSHAREGFTPDRTRRRESGPSVPRAQGLHRFTPSRLGKHAVGFALTRASRSETSPNAPGVGRASRPARAPRGVDRRDTILLADGRIDRATADRGRT